MSGAGAGVLPTGVPHVRRGRPGAQQAAGPAAQSSDPAATFPAAADAAAADPRARRRRAPAAAPALTPLRARGARAPTPAAFHAGAVDAVGAGALASVAGTGAEVLLAAAAPAPAARLPARDVGARPQLPSGAAALPPLPAAAPAP